MALKDVPHQMLEIGDKVKMDIEAIMKRDDMDGIEVTKTGENYLKYMLAHPEEVYTVVELDLDYEYCPYVLSGPMGNNTWSRDELIYVPQAQTRFEVIKNMTLQEMATDLIPMIGALCEDGVPCPDWVEMWLNGAPQEQGEGG